MASIAELRSCQWAGTLFEFGPLTADSMNSRHLAEELVQDR